LENLPGFLLSFTQKEGVIVSDEMNIVNNETKENIAETCSGEDKGVKDENKIVPINKASSAYSENAASTAELAAQLVAQYAALAANQSGIYAASQISAYHNAPSAAQAQLAIHAASLSAGQPVDPTATQSANLSVTDTASRFGFQPVTGTATQTGSQPMTATAAQTDSQAAAATQVQPQPGTAAQTQSQSGVEAFTQTQSQSGAVASTQTQSQPAATASTQAGVQSATSTDAQTGFANTSDVETASNSSAGQGVNAADYMETEPDDEPRRGSLRRRFFRSEPEDDFDFDEEERPKKRFFRFRSANEEESRDKLILSRIKDEDLMEYLALEQRRIEFLQQAKEAKEKRILIAFQLLISLAAIVAITYLLQDNPTILISILYIVGIVAALNVWKNPHDKGRKR